MSLSSLSTGAALGLAIAAPIGPMGVLCIERTLTLGVRGGLATGVAAATVHVLYGSIAGAGLGAAPQIWLSEHARIASVGLALLLLWLAAKMYRRNTIGIVARVQDAKSTIRLYSSALALGMVNPSTLLLFIAAVPLLSGEKVGVDGALLVTGILLGSLSWWLVLVTFVHAARTRIGPRLFALSGKVTALILGLIAVRSLVVALL